MTGGTAGGNIAGRRCVKSRVVGNPHQTRDRVQVFARKLVSNRLSGVHLILFPTDGKQCQQRFIYFRRMFSKEWRVKKHVQKNSNLQCDATLFYVNRSHTVYASFSHSHL